MKFMKDILSKKRKFIDYDTIALIMGKSAITNRRLSPKLKDSGTFHTPCIIRDHQLEKPLYDLGASFDLIPW